MHISQSLPPRKCQVAPAVQRRVAGEAEQQFRPFLQRGLGDSNGSQVCPENLGGCCLGLWTQGTRRELRQREGRRRKRGGGNEVEAFKANKVS